MDSRKLAEEILDRLFNSEEVLAEQNKPEEEEDQEDQEEEYDAQEEEGEEDEDEDEYEGEEDEDEDEDEDYEDEGEEEEPEPKAEPKAEPKGNSMTSASSTLQMKSSFNQSTPSMKSGFEGAAIVADAHGGTAKDALGKGDVLGTAVAPQQQPVPQLASPGGYVGGAAMQEELQKDVRMMFEGQEDLSEEFVQKATSLYEAAVVGKIKKISKALHEQYEKVFEEKIVTITEALVGQIDHYMEYVVEEWMKENELAVENGVRTEIAENFIENLKTLFEQSYIEVPQSKTDIFDELTEAIENLENRINEEMDTNSALVRENKALKANAIFVEETAHLSDNSVEKIAEIAENIRFESVNDYRSKIHSLVENYQKSNKTSSTPKKTREERLFESAVLDVEEPIEEEVQLPSTIRNYYEAIERTLKG